MPNSASPLTAKPLVMVVDDDTRVLRSLEIVLKPKFEVLSFPRAVLALREMDRRLSTPNEASISVVILDIKMPEMDGFAAFKEIRKRAVRLPIIFNSAYQDQEHPDAVQYQYGPYGYISKGAKVRDFVNLVQRAVDDAKGPAK